MNKDDAELIIVMAEDDGIYNYYNCHRRKIKIFGSYARTLN